MDFPAEKQIRATIRAGSVYYFHLDSFTSASPHYFVVINRKPLTDSVVLLLCASSQVEKRKLWYSACPLETLVIVNLADYPHFTVPTVINCNSVFEVTIPQLAQKLEKRQLSLRSEMAMPVVESLRQGVQASPLVEPRVKAFLI